MANTRQARKRARQAETHRQHNASRRTLVRTRIKQVNKAIEDGNKDAAQAAFRTAVSVIDRAASNSLMHRNTAARYKSRLNARVKAMA